MLLEKTGASAISSCLFGDVFEDILIVELLDTAAYPLAQW